jgi:heterodisulfide reductase subunit D
MNALRDELNIRTMAQWQSSGEKPDVLFWVGCAGSFDERARRVTRAVAQILEHVGMGFAVLGTEESCSGDPARRAGNEFLFQMQAMQNIMVMNGYGVQKIVTACPHCFNTIRNEYPELGGRYEVVHHATLLQQLINEGRLKIKDGGAFKGKRITFHDSCYLGRANGIYEAPREVLQSLDADLVEMKRSRAQGLCCGAGGAQLFKESEKGTGEVHHERSREAIATEASVVAVACPFCMTMMRDGVKHHNKEHDVEVLDIAELMIGSGALSPSEAN